MKRTNGRQWLALLTLCVTSATAAQAGQVVVRHWNMGEDDPGAVPGGLVGMTTLDASGFENPSPENRQPQYLTNATFGDPNGPVYSSESPTGDDGVTARSILLRGFPVDTSPSHALHAPAVQPYVIFGGDFGHLMQAWVKPLRPFDGNPLEESVFNNGHEHRIYIKDGYWALHETGAIINEYAQVRYDQWNHIAFTHGGSNWRFYVNGTQIAGALDNYGGWGGDIVVGAFADATYQTTPFTGLVSAAEISAFGAGLGVSFNRSTDLMIWQDLPRADADLDNDTDADDLAALRTNFGFVNGASVPTGAGLAAGAGQGLTRNMGDADIDGDVDRDDIEFFIAAELTRLGDANLDGTVTVADRDLVTANLGMTGATWVTGDFTRDGTVNQADLDIVNSMLSEPDGDLNGDGATDRIDVALFATYYGLTSGGAPNTGDLNGDTAVTLADLALLQTNLDPLAGAGPTAHAAVPEPATAALAAIALLIAFRLVRRSYSPYRAPENLARREKIVSSG